MGKSKSKKAEPSSSKAPKCTCDDPYKCTCGNRPERPSKGHKWYPEEQIWAGKGHKQKGASGQVASISQQAQVTTKGKTTISQWQRLPSQLLVDFCQRQKRPRPHYKQLPLSDTSAYKFRLIVKDTKQADKDLFFVPANAVQNEEQAREEAALLALLQLTPTLPHERKLPEPYRTTWLNSLAATSNNGGGKQQAQPRSKSNSAVAISPAKQANSKPTTTKGTTNEKKKAHATSQPATAQASTHLVSAVKYSSQAEKRKAIQERNQQKAARVRKREALAMANRPPPVMMSESMRKQIEALLRGESNNSSLEDDDEENDEQDDEENETKDYVVDRLHQEGFTLKQAKAAYVSLLGKTNNAGDDWDKVYEECLQWLLVNLNEDQLPISYDPRGHSLDVIVSGGADGMATNSAEVDTILARLDLPRTDANLLAKVAAERKMLFLDCFWQAACKAVAGKISDSTGCSLDKSEVSEIFADEVEALDSIYASSYQKSESGDFTTIRISDDDMTLEVQVKTTAYPASRPTLVVVDKSTFALHAELAKFVCELPLGEPMIFAIHAQAMELLHAGDNLPSATLSSVLASGNEQKDKKQNSKDQAKAAAKQREAVVPTFRKRAANRKRGFWSLSPEQTPTANSSPKVLQSIQRVRDSLPAAGAKREFLDALAKAAKGGRVLLVTGETGSGMRVKQLCPNLVLSNVTDPLQ